MTNLIKQKIGLRILILLNLLFIGIQAPCSAAVYTLQWDQNTEPDLVGYRVYYRTGAPGYNYVDFFLAGDPPAGNDQDPSLTTFETLPITFPDNAAFIAVTAYDSEGLESDRTEIAVDTDNDGIPSYLDTDDDGGGGSCFIATAAYESPLDVRVSILGQFRGHILLLMTVLVGLIKNGRKAKRIVMSNED